MEESLEDVAVVGAGPGGLAFSLAVARVGRRVVIFEKAPNGSRFGAGIQITPNGSSILKALGLGDRLKNCCARADELEIWDYRGNSRIAVLPLRPAFGVWPGPYWITRRKDLLSVLREEALNRGIEIRHGCDVRGIKIFDDGAVCRFSNYSSRKFDLVVGADGINSVVRTELNGPCQARFSGYVAWRASIPASSSEMGLGLGKIRVAVAPRRHVVMYPVHGGKIINVVAVEERSRWEGSESRRIGEFEAFRGIFGDFGQPIRKIIENCVVLEEWGLFEQGVAPVCWKGRAAIIGDAMHPMLPFLGQGANAALEDAWTLAAQIANNDSIEDAFKRFQLVRRSRVAKVVARSRRQALALHIANPNLRFAARAMLRLANSLYPEALGMSMHWLYSKDVSKSNK